MYLRLVVSRISRINFSGLGHDFHVSKEGWAPGGRGQVTCQVTYLLTKTASHWQLKHIEDWLDNVGLYFIKN